MDRQTGRRLSGARRRQEREQRTVETMIAMYCRANHGGGRDLCPECQELRDYSRRKVERCPLLADKPACNRCPVHCYTPEMREIIRRVMRYAGPRMPLRHPVMTLFHIVDLTRGPKS